jgi:hypothetical protein
MATKAGFGVAFDAPAGNTWLSLLNTSVLIDLLAAITTCRRTDRRRRVALPSFTVANWPLGTCRIIPAENGYWSHSQEVAGHRVQHHGATLCGGGAERPTMHVCSRIALFAPHPFTRSGKGIQCLSPTPLLLSTTSLRHPRPVALSEEGSENGETVSPFLELSRHVGGELRNGHAPAFGLAFGPRRFFYAKRIQGGRHGSARDLVPKLRNRCGVSRGVQIRRRR